MKTNQKKSKQLDTFGQFGEQFGLGIQVFKIESSKSINKDRGKQRALMRNIENPNVYKNPPPMPKRTHLLPSLDKARTGMDEVFQGKATLQRKKPVALERSVEQKPTQKKTVPKKAVTVAKMNLTNMEKHIIPAQKAITHKHYRSFLQEVIDFHENLEQREVERAREIRKLQRLKDIELAEPQAQRLNQLMRQNTLQQLLQEEQVKHFVNQQAVYDQFDITYYSVQDGFVREECEEEDDGQY